MADKKERRSVKRVDCYNRSLSHDEIEHSLVVDMNNEGAGLLLTKEKSFFRTVNIDDHLNVSGNVHLTIFHPDTSCREGVDINAEVIWKDDDYSKDHYKVGVRFIDKDDEQVDKLTQWLSKKSNYFFHCELEKR